MERRSFRNGVKADTLLIEEVAFVGAAIPFDWTSFTLPLSDAISFVLLYVHIRKQNPTLLISFACRALSPIDLLLGPLRPVIAPLDHVIEHVASVTKEAPSKAAIEAAMRRDTNARKLFKWKANLTESGIQHFTFDAKRPGKPPAEDTPYGLYDQLRHNV